MVHVSCDLCGTILSAVEDVRYIVRMEVFASRDPGTLTDADLSADALDEVSDMLQAQLLSDSANQIPVPARQEFTFDLCSDCRKKFARDPLSRESQKLSFSPN